MNSQAVRVPDGRNNSRLPWMLAALKRVQFFGLTALVLISPLPLASDRPLAAGVLAVCVGLLIGIGLFVPEQQKAGLPPHLWVPAALFVFVLCYLFFQTMTFLPHALDNVLWGQAREALSLPISGSISVDRHATLVEIARFGTYGGVFYLAHRMAQSTTDSRAALKLLVLGETAYAAYGLVVYGTGNHTVLWFPKISYYYDLTSTFINRNSFATYLGIGTLAAIAQIALLFARKRRFGDTLRDQLREGVEFFSGKVWIFLCLFIVVTGLLLTHSRGGILSTSIAVVLLLFILGRDPQNRLLRKWRLGLVPALLVLLAIVVSGGGVMERLAGPDLGDARAAIYRLTWHAIKDYPWLGTGSGTFGSIFPIYRTETIPVGFVNAAHDDYLENLLELGIPVALVLFASVSWLAGLCIRGMIKYSRLNVFAALGFASSALVAIHSTIDFSLQIPAVTITYMFVLGLGVAHSRPRRNSGAPATIILQPTLDQNPSA